MTEPVTNRRRGVHTVDSHTEGNPTRVIVGGVAVPPGATLLERQSWLSEHDDSLRELLCYEPRGGGLMCSVLLMPAISVDADFSVLIMEQEGFVPMSGHCIIGAATTVVEMRMVAVSEPQTIVRFDTPAGLVTCHLTVRDGLATSVSFENVDCFVDRQQAPIDAGYLGTILVDIAYGGDYYSIVDADALKLRLDRDNDASIIQAAVAVRRAVATQLTVQHPERPEIDACYQVMFTSKYTRTGDYKQTIVSPPGAIDRSPCGTGTSARLALMAAQGVIDVGTPYRFEGIIGTCFLGQIERKQTRAERCFITPRITGSAHITGYHHFVLAKSDPFPRGFRLGPQPDVS